VAYRISEVAARTGFSPATLRYYEEIGLIPEPARTPAGYRVFDEEHLDLLDFISQAKRLGLPLEEITTLSAAWSRDDCRAAQDQLVALLATKLAEIRHRIGDLVRFGEQLEQVHADLSGRSAPARCGPECGCDIEVTLLDRDLPMDLTLVSTRKRSR
jgi:DNA-binding transcriptional MerR regulator